MQRLTLICIGGWLEAGLFACNESLISSHGKSFLSVWENIGSDDLWFCGNLQSNLLLHIMPAKLADVCSQFHSWQCWSYFKDVKPNNHRHSWTFWYVDRRDKKDSSISNFTIFTITTLSASWSRPKENGNLSIYERFNYVSIAWF